tara:strand:- start:169 stop:510 length:342 start_codon:yes stop_codon:yes gene_type:complete
MAITTTWTVTDMTHVDADGGVIAARWMLIAKNDSGTEYAKEYGKEKFTYDASGSEFIAYKDLKESDVLGWVWKLAKEDDETAEEFKARIESDRTAKVQAQIDRKAVQADGLPW